MVFHIANKSGIAAKEERNEFVNITQFVAQNGRYFLILQPENFLNSFVQMLQGGGLLSCQAERFSLSDSFSAGANAVRNAILTPRSFWAPNVQWLVVRILSK